MQAYSMPCCGSVGGCGARAVSRKTPIYFMLGFCRSVYSFIPIIDQISSTTDVNVTSFLFNLESERITREGKNANTSCVENLQK